MRQSTSFYRKPSFYFDPLYLVYLVLRFAATFNWLNWVHLPAAPAGFLQQGTRGKKRGRKKNKLFLSSSSRSTLQKLHNFSTLSTDPARCINEHNQKRERRFFKKKKKSSTYTVKNIESAERVPRAHVSPANHRVPRDSSQR